MCSVYVVVLFSKWPCYYSYYSSRYNYDVSSKNATIQHLGHW